MAATTASGHSRPEHSGWGCRACGGANPDGTRFCGHCGAPGAALEPADEQRLVTALFADISGFTTLADALDAEALHAVIAPVISLLAGVAERYGGTLAKYAGDAVLVFFGAPVAQEDHASRALLCALEMHRELEVALPRLPPASRGLELHIGVNSGRVVAGVFGGEVRGDYSILGDAVNVAQRLESLAPAGETYVGESTQQLTGREFRLEPLGELTVKGKPRPVPAWRLLGRRAEHESVRTLPSSADTLVGRRAEVRRVMGAVARAAEHGALVTIVAEPGAGKSRFTQEIREQSERRDIRWLEARAVSYGASLAYWPFVDLVRRVFSIRMEHDPDLASARLAEGMAQRGLAAGAPYFARLLGLPPPPGSDRLDEYDPEAFRRGLHDTFRSWLTALAGGRRVVLAFEDVHWIDDASVDLLTEIAALGHDHPVSLYLTARPAGEQAIARVAASGVPYRVALQLASLRADQIAQLVSGALGCPAGDALLALVLDRAEGNPFFTQELVRSLHESGALEIVGGRCELRDGWDAARVPPTIEGVIAARIDAMTRAATAVLQLASVVGRLVDVALLEAVAEDVTDLRGAIDELVAAALLDRATVNGEERVTFHHALVVDVAYSRLLRRQRRDLHRRVAEASEVLYGTGDDVIDLLARHFYLAEAGVKAVEYLERAAARATRLYANRQAILHIDRAIEIARRTTRLESRLPLLLLRAADVEELIGDYDGATRRYVEVRSRTSDVRSWRGLAAVLRKQGRPGEALAVLDRAVRDERLRDHAPLLWLERAAVLEIEGRLAEAVEAARSGLAAGPAPDHVSGELLLRLARAEEAIVGPEAALTHASAAERIFEHAGDLRGLTSALRVVGGLQWLLGRVDDGVATLERALEFAERTGSAEEQGACLVNLGMAELRRGRVRHAIGFDRSAIDVFERVGHASGQAQAHSNLAEKLVLAGDLAGAEHHAATAMALAVQVGDIYLLADAHRTTSVLLVRQGRYEEAVVAAEEAARLFTEAGDLDEAADALAVVSEPVPLPAPPC